MINYITDPQKMTEALEKLSNKKILAVDTETTGLDPIANKILLIQIGDRFSQFVFDTARLGNSIKDLNPLLQNEGIIKVFHNAKFDLEFLRTNLGVTCNNIRCTMVCDQLLYAGRKVSHSLKNTLNRHLGVTMSKEEQKSFAEMKFGDEFTREQIEYAGADVINLVELYSTLEKLIKERDMLELMDLEMDTIHATCDLELNGIYLDKTRWLALKDTAQKEAIAAKADLDSHFIEHCEVDMFGGLTVNYNSPKQLKPLLEKITGFELASTNVQMLKRVKHPVIDALITYREHTKKLTTYGEDFLNTHVSSVSGRVHSSFIQLGADSGRYASRNPNMTNIPSDPRYRAAFRVQDENNRMISADFSGQELRLLAHMSQEKGFLDALEKGIDLHTNSASLIFNIPYDDVKKDQRTAAKSLTFGLIYGIGPKKLSENLEIKYDDARHLMDKYYRTFPSIKTLLDELVVKARQSHVAVSPLDKRQRDLSTFDWYNRREVAHALNITKNLPFQGAGASVTKKALVMLRESLIKNKFDAKIVNVIHDEIVVESNSSCANEVSQCVKNSMIDAFHYFAPSVPMEVDPEISDCWVH